MWPAWSPDGMLMPFEGFDGSGVSVVGVHTRESVWVRTDPVMDPVWLDDGTLLLLRA